MSQDLSRRDVLAAAALSIAPATRAATGLIDVHHHVVPPGWREALERIGADKSGDAPIPPWDESNMLRTMDAADIAAAVVSVSAPGVFFDKPNAGLPLARDLARLCNDFVAETVARHHDRLAGLGVLPLPDVDQSLDELARCLDDLKLGGVLLLTNYAGIPAHDPRFAAVYDALDERGTVALLHPTAPLARPTRPDVPDDLPSFIYDFPFDTTRAAASLLFGGTLARCPDAKLILAHAGGSVPMLTQRLTLAARLRPDLAESAGGDVAELLGRFYLDTAIASDAAPLAAARKLARPGHLLFGSDHPYLPDDLVKSEAAAIRDAGLADDTADAARALFPSLA